MLEHCPTPQLRDHVKKLAAVGTPINAIAGMIGVAPNTLRKHYDSEIEYGRGLAAAKVMSVVYRKAIEYEHPQQLGAAQMFMRQTGFEPAQEVNLNHSGGVLVTPNTMTPEEFEQAAIEQQGAVVADIAEEMANDPLLNKAGSG